jgi:hypothetical protein
VTLTDMLIDGTTQFRLSHSPKSTLLSLQKAAFSGDGTDDDDGGSIFYSSPTQMAIQVISSPLESRPRFFSTFGKGTVSCD